MREAGRRGANNQTDWVSGEDVQMYATLAFFKTSITVTLQFRRPDPANKTHRHAASAPDRYTVAVADAYSS